MNKKISAINSGLTGKLILALIIAVTLFSALSLTPVYSLDATATSVTPSPSSVTIGNTITFTANVTDIPSPPTTPTGKVTWSDGVAGGSFTPSSCSLGPSGNCTSVYTPPSKAATVTITASYGGDLGHSISSGTSTLTVNLRSTSTKVSPNPSTVIIGNTIAFSVTIADTSSGSASTPSGTVTWSDGVAGGSFSKPGSCSLLSGACTIVYTPPSTSGPVTITATYGGDPTHAVSSGTSSLTILTPAQATQNLITLIGTFNLNHGLTNSLDAKLRAAIDSLNRGSSTSAKNQLNAFINEVNAKCCGKPQGKPLTTSQATMLIADAQEISKAIP